MDYFEALGIKKGATKDEIKEGFKILALKYHPDKNKNKDVGEIFKKIRRAYEALMKLAPDSKQQTSKQEHPSTYESSKPKQKYSSTYEQSYKQSSSSFHYSPKPDHQKPKQVDTKKTYQKTSNSKQEYSDSYQQSSKQDHSYQQSSRTNNQQSSKRNKKSSKFKQNYSQKSNQQFSSSHQQTTPHYKSSNGYQQSLNPNQSSSRSYNQNSSTYKPKSSFNQQYSNSNQIFFNYNTSLGSYQQYYNTDYPYSSSNQDLLEFYVNEELIANYEEYFESNNTSSDPNHQPSKVLKFFKFTFVIIKTVIKFVIKVILFVPRVIIITLFYVVEILPTVMVYLSVAFIGILAISAIMEGTSFAIDVASRIITTVSSGIEITFRQINSTFYKLWSFAMNVIPSHSNKSASLFNQAKFTVVKSISSIMSIFYPAIQFIAGK